MKLYSANIDYTLYQGNMKDMLEVIKPETIDSIVADPPYELNFMGKGWDNSGIAFQVDTWQKCYEVLKPGGYLLAFGGSRTFHRIACAIEDAGFEIRDTIMWLYGSGFPKSMNIGLAIDKRNGIEVKNDYIPNMKNNIYGKAMGGGNVEAGHIGQQAQNKWNGWGTCLKPSFEPIIVARKPFKGSLVDNVLEHGVGGINIDECRVGEIGGVKKVNIEPNSGSKNSGFGCNGKLEELNKGRFPANTILTYDETDFDEVCGGFPNTKSNGGKTTMSDFSKYKGSMMNTTNLKEQSARKQSDYIAPCDSGSASRYFYCAKASKKDRDEGCDTLNDGLLRRMRPDKDDNNPTGLNKEGRFAPIVRKNTHPTVKPTELMQYLVRLVTPKGGVVLDPFNGSGSTGKAVMYENKERNKNYKYIGIELTEEYLPIAKARIEYVSNLPKIEKEKTLFDIEVK